MALDRYVAKRDFRRTPEPRGAAQVAPGDGLYVIQEHAARRHHYDLRLELDGVLKSWAVPEGPSLVPGVKRLAVATEDHPLDYASFEGTIPAGNYGAGRVIVWDRGRWRPERDEAPAAALRKGHLRLRLDGEKLRGAFDLVRMAKKPGERTTNWLLIKVDDADARAPGDPDPVASEPQSVVSGRTIAELDPPQTPPAPSERHEPVTPKGRAVAERNRRRAPASAPHPAAPRPTSSPRGEVKGAGDATSPVPVRRKASGTKSAGDAATSPLPDGERSTPKASGEGSPSLATRRTPSPASRSATARHPLPRGERGGGASGAAQTARLRGAAAAPMALFVPPALAEPARRAPAGADWVHEIKFDGYRLQARLDHGRVTLRTRTGLDWTAKFQRLAAALARLDMPPAILDGELVVETPEGLSSFAALQADLKAKRDERLVFYVFDLLHLAGQDLTGAAFADRRAALEALLTGQADGAVRLSEQFRTDGEALRAHACRLGFEGIVSKRLSARYRSGRSGDWLKSKCSNRQEFAVVGYVPSTTARRAIGSLALGLYDGGRLRYTGRVGSGFSTAVAEALWAELEPLRRPKIDITIPPEADVAGVRWVDPQLVAEVEFRTWTAEGLVRHAVFHGRRDDKRAEEAVAEEQPAAEPAPAAPRVRLTHPDRLYWPDVGISKQGLADYVTAVWDHLGPHVVRRPLSLVRCPGGIDGGCFYQKHAWAGLDTAVVRRGQAGADEYLWIDTLEGALALVQAGVIEIHPWGSRVDDPDKADLIIFDLDPGEGVLWDAVEAAAVDMRERLATMRLVSFVKTTGGKGLHVVVPIAPTDWTAAKPFTERVAKDMAKADRRYIAVMSKAERRDRIFVDYLRNGRGATAVAAFSPRARAGAPVSTPLAWSELGTGLRPAQFTMLTVPRRLEGLREDPWAGYASVRQPLPAPTPAGRRR